MTISDVGYPPKGHYTLMPLHTPIGPVQRDANGNETPVQLLLGVRLDRDGVVATATGARIAYHVGDKHYVADADDLISVCTPEVERTKYRSCQPK